MLFGRLAPVQEGNIKFRVRIECEVIGYILLAYYKIKQFALVEVEVNFRILIRGVECIDQSCDCRLL
jgi:hypothetical protein